MNVTILPAKTKKVEFGHLFLGAAFYHDKCYYIKTTYKAEYNALLIHDTMPVTGSDIQVTSFAQDHKVTPVNIDVTLSEKT